MVELQRAAAPSGPKSVSINEGAPCGMDERETLLDQWLPILKYGPDKHWRRKGEKSESRYAINGTSICITPSGEKYVQFRVEKFIPTTAFNAATKSQIEVRRRVITYSASGEPYFPEFGIPAVDFEAQFEADGWQGQAEAVEMHRELGPTIERETAARQGEQAAIAERNARAGSRARNADNPQAELASAISAGIATALAELGLAKKGGKI